MPFAYQIHKQDAAYFLTMTAVEWVEVLSRREAKQLICDSLNHCIEQKGLEVFAYVIMSNHLHLVVRARQGNLSDIVRDFKKYTSSALIRMLRQPGESRREWLVPLLEKGGNRQKKMSRHQLWQYNNHAEEVFSSQFARIKINYIHQNPVKAGLVDRATNYIFSSARDYAGIPGPVKVTVLDRHQL